MLIEIQKRYNIFSVYGNCSGAHKITITISSTAVQMSLNNLPLKSKRRPYKNFYEAHTLELNWTFHLIQIQRIVRSFHVCAAFIKGISKGRNTSFCIFPDWLEEVKVNPIVVSICNQLTRSRLQSKNWKGGYGTLPISSHLPVPIHSAHLFITSQVCTGYYCIVSERGNTCQELYSVQNVKKKEREFFVSSKKSILIQWKRMKNMGEIWSSCVVLEQE